MDYSNLPNANFPSLVSKNLNGKRKVEEGNSIKVSPKKPRLLHSYQPQQWSFPDSIIYYITMTPSSSKAYQKMIQSCKYFFAKNPIIVLSQLTYYHYNRGYWDGRLENEYITRIDWHEKVWIIDSFVVAPRSFNPNLASSVVPKIYQCNVKVLQLYDQIISYDQFLFLASNAIEIGLNRVVVNAQDGTVLPIEKLVEVLSKAKNIEILTAVTSVKIEAMNEFLENVRETITSKSLKKLIKIEHFKNLDKFSIYGATEAFDIETFYSYMKTNKNTKMFLRYTDTISQAKKNRLETIIDEIIATEEHDYRPPCISFQGLENEKWERINEMFQED